ncbi:UxaA family hydrolase [Paenibacillus baimaensis]|uniref:UxaA family hydrolase n=1 Tax=Paenibacillus baimaensis TaxID=2982185 RepID=UPI00293F5599|nr:UxaA family hydrolase [Paenibacillus sp. WQ 127069]
MDITENMHRAVMMKKKDNVAMALGDIPAGVAVELRVEDIHFTVTMRDSIAFGHKFAVRPISIEEDIVKYGEVIGMANRNIQEGEHVHVHNLDGKRGRGDQHGA